MLRTDPFKSLPRVGAGTRSVRSGASTKRSVRSVRGDAVEIQERRFGYFPQRFRWRGKTHEVQAVERCWTKAGQRAQLCFRVRCGEGCFDLTQHVKTNIWTLAIVQVNS
jgi:hypothetical protein